VLLSLSWRLSGASSANAATSSVTVAVNTSTPRSRGRKPDHNRLRAPSREPLTASKPVPNPAQRDPHARFAQRHR
jgi:hypothetical protein